MRHAKACRKPLTGSLILLRTQRATTIIPLNPRDAKSAQAGYTYPATSPIPAAIWSTPVHTRIFGNRYRTNSSFMRCDTRQVVP